MHAILISLVFVGAMDRSDPAGDLSLAEAIRNAYQANRATLTFGTLHYDFSVGASDGLTAALEGEWTWRATGRGLYVFDGDRARFERVFTPEVTLAHRTPLAPQGWSDAVPTSIRLLTDGEVTLRNIIQVGENATQVTHLARIHPGTEQFYHPFLMPLNLGNPKPDGYQLSSDLDAALRRLEGWHVAEVDDTVKLDGVDVVKLTLAKGESRRVYWVDIERGAIPLRIVSGPEDHPVVEIRHADLRFVGGRGWFPHREIIVLRGTHVKEIVVQEADFDHPPDASLFALEFPEERAIIDEARALRYEPRKILRLDRLPSASSPESTPVVVTPPPVAPTLPGEREPTPVWSMPLMGLGAVLLATAGILVYRWRRSL